MLLSRDPLLDELVRIHRPPEAHLQVLNPEDPLPQTIDPDAELWLDLDYAAAPANFTGRRLVYFHRGKMSRRPDAHPGLYVRKPCAGTAIQVLWAHHCTNLPVQSAAPAERERDLPAWFLDFHQLDLRELCRHCIHGLGPRLGYGEVSLYIHDAEQRLLKLAETTYTRSIDLAVSLQAAEHHLMVSVAQERRLLVTSSARSEWQRRNLVLPDSGRRYLDQHCVIAPLVSAGRLWGVLNLSLAHRSARSEVGVPLAPLFALIGRALHHALLFEEARTQARVDMLTGLYNQRWMTEALSREIHLAQRTGKPLAVIVLDLDGLKFVNDTYGHAAGDSLLRHVSSRIRTALRESDAAARMGGDEFAMLLPGTDFAGAGQVARRVLAALQSDAAIIRDQAFPVGASLGLAQWQSGWSVTQLLDVADRRMYDAKRRGGRQIGGDNGQPAVIPAAIPRPRSNSTPGPAKEVRPSAMPASSSAVPT